MSIKETAKTYAKKTFEFGKKFVKAGVKFVKEHPKESIYILVGGISVGYVTSCLISVRKSVKETDPIAEELNDICADIKKLNEEKEWNELYKETWDKVNEFAKTLSLKPGEMYIIEDQMQFKDDPFFTEVDFSMPVISHLVFNEDIYPPTE